MKNDNQRDEDNNEEYESDNVKKIEKVAQELEEEKKE